MPLNWETKTESSCTATSIPRAAIALEVAAVREAHASASAISSFKRGVIQASPGPLPRPKSRTDGASVDTGPRPGSDAPGACLGPDLGRKTPQLPRFLPGEHTFV